MSLIGKKKKPIHDHKPKKGFGLRHLLLYISLLALVLFYHWYNRAGILVSTPEQSDPAVVPTTQFKLTVPVPKGMKEQLTRPEAEKNPESGKESALQPEKSDEDK